MMWKTYVVAGRSGFDPVEPVCTHPRPPVGVPGISGVAAVSSRFSTLLSTGCPRACPPVVHGLVHRVVHGLFHSLCTQAVDEAHDVWGKAGIAATHLKACCWIRLVSSAIWLYRLRRSAICCLILRSACITVVWSRPPNDCPMRGSDRSV